MPAALTQAVDHGEVVQSSTNTQSTKLSGITVPKNAVVIKIEDDVDNPILPSPFPLHTGQDAIFTYHLPEPDAKPMIKDADSSIYLDDNIEAVLNNRRNKIQSLEHECTKLRFMLKCFGVSEMQMKVLSQKFDAPQGGQWEQSCRAVFKRFKV